VETLQQNEKRLHLLNRTKKEGLGKAYIAGFRWALDKGSTYDCVFEMDADFSHDPKYLEDFLKVIPQNDLVIGSRYVTGVNVVNWPMSRLLISYFGNLYARLITGIPIRDCTAGFKCFRIETLRKLNLEKISSSGYSFQIEVNFMAWKKGMRILEIPIIFVDRFKGTSKMGGGHCSGSVGSYLAIKNKNLFFLRFFKIPL